MNTKKEYDENGERLGVIYEIYNCVNNKRYIGQSICYKDRWINHKNNLNKGIHDNYILQNDWNIYGSDNFIFRIVENKIPQSKLKELETVYMNSFGGIESNAIYNMEDNTTMNSDYRNRHKVNARYGKNNNMYKSNRYKELNPNYNNYKYTQDFINQLRIEKQYYTNKQLSEKYCIDASIISNLIRYGTPAHPKNYKYYKYR